MPLVDEKGGGGGTLGHVRVVCCVKDVQKNSLAYSKICFPDDDAATNLRSYLRNEMDQKGKVSFFVFCQHR